MSNVLYLQHLAGQPVEQIEESVVSNLRERVEYLERRNRALKDEMERRERIYDRYVLFLGFCLSACFCALLWVAQH